MKVIRYPEREKWAGLLKRPVMDIRAIDDRVIPVLNDVKKNGDIAVLNYTRQFDGIALKSLRVEEDEYIRAEQLMEDSLKDAISFAVRNIDIFHRSQQSPVRKIGITNGVECWQRSVPIEKVGLYIPGGSAPLFSTVLMLAVPARIAGCKEIILCTPPGKDGTVHPAILYAARFTGVTGVFKAGGSQAIAAMAYGTQTVPRVYKIFGPGNQYVMAAKQLVSRDDIAIDMPAGPSELAVIADRSANPAFIASDLLSQAEHGPDSQVLLFSSDEEVIRLVIENIENQIVHLPRKDIARKALENSKMIILHDKMEIMDMVNEYAPEHLIIAAADVVNLAEKVKNAGSVFLGNYAPESAGDYLSGTNHTLPTNGYARMYNGVNLDSFVKKITFQQISEDGLGIIGPAIMQMAENEGLIAHKNAVKIRFGK